MRELRTPGSVRGVLSNGHSYRDIRGPTDCWGSFARRVCSPDCDPCDALAATARAGRCCPSHRRLIE
ncbi:hypothetical protein E0W60_33990 (plasmid) [Cupriavidus oxalaticus]|uniref:Uncharacterized protein n=1 Tax=Cupriavidus oxalaticus TaxID=96344 RepID=A0A4P7LML8_9BURK|nr:hypothetical protein E0W60_33990 [Cupriavidus oxalaticus]